MATSSSSIHRNPPAEILTIGAELLKGTVLNTNAKFLGTELTGLGFDVKYQTACDDSISAIVEQLRESFMRSRLIVATGGLGPTPDDLTRDAVASYFGVPLVFSKSQFSRTQQFYRHSKRPIPSIVRREAMYPLNAVPLINRYGIAIGFYVSDDDRFLFVLPGVPYEMEKMFREVVQPLIKRHFRKMEKKHSLIVKLVGISEPEVMRRLGADFFVDDFEFGIYPAPGEAALRLYSHQSRIIGRLKRKVQARLKSYLYAFGEVSLAETLGQILSRRHASLSVAESCTGGAIASEITKVPGSSRYFKGGLVAYDNQIKQTCLGIPSQMLKQKGAVSKETAAAMAVQVRKRMDTTYGISVTGIAGPSGGSRKKPVGLVYIGVADKRGSSAQKFQFRGDRAAVQIKATKKALELLWRKIR